MDSSGPVSGEEIEVYDRERRPRDWDALLGPKQCAVFIQHTETAAPLSPAGTGFARYQGCTCCVFESLAAARAFSEGKVLQFPFMRCEIFDSAGKSKPPLLVVAHPSVAEKDELSVSSVRRRKLIAAVLLAVAPALIWWDWRSQWALIVPTFLAVTSIVAALRMLHNMARTEHARESENRIKDHLARAQLSEK
jgi:hypothetical protein